MKARRSILQRLPRQKDTNAGLWMDRFLSHQTESKSGAQGQENADESSGTAKAKAELLQQLSTLEIPMGYRAAIADRRRSLESLCLTAEAAAVGRLIIGIGQKGPLEVGLHLDHTWGVPVLPGSALKGLCAATAHHLLHDKDWRKSSPNGESSPGPSQAWLFGTIERIGQVIFHDAWWVPGPEEMHLPIYKDVMTVHHPDYYQGKSVAQKPGPDVPPPSDMDSPIPVSFASVTGTFLIAVEGDLEWTKAALSILKIGLRELGLGAKTNAGYGRMELDFESEVERRVSEAARAQAAAAKEAERQKRQQEDAEKQLPGVIKRLNLGSAANLVPEWLGRLKGPRRRSFAQRAVEKLTRKSLKGKTDQWAVDLLSAESAPACDKE